jgi:hypothetical protein
MNTSLFCALCPYSYAPRNNFPVGHSSSNCSRPSTLNLEFFSDEHPEKKVYLVDISILSILLSPGQDVTLTHANSLIFEESKEEALIYISTEAIYFPLSFA